MVFNRSYRLCKKEFQIIGLMALETRRLMFLIFTQVEDPPSSGSKLQVKVQTLSAKAWALEYQ